MKKILTFFRFVSLSLVVMLASTIVVSAQNVDAKAGKNLVAKNAAILGLTSQEISNSRVSDAYFDQTSGSTMVYLQQTYKGVDVFNSIQSVAFKGDKAAVFSAKRMADLETLAGNKSSNPKIAARQAVQSAAAHLGLPAPQQLVATKLKGDARQLDFGKINISTLNVTAKLLWVINDKNPSATLCWQIMVQPKGKPDLWLVNVDAENGNVISKENLNISCDFTPVHKVVNKNTQAAGNSSDLDALLSSTKAGYGVIPYPAESPNVQPPSAAINPWKMAGPGNNATTLQWNNDGTQVYDSTRGNNVLAQEDRNGNNGSGDGAVSRRKNVIAIAYRPDFSQDPTTPNNQKFAITNLFYWNNIMHDISYQYGFDEPSGNFQANNLGRGGAGNDFVFADAQDGSGTNNANFSTPSDGSSPRMQMFLFDAVPTTTILSPKELAGNVNSTESAFSSNNKLSVKGPIVGQVVLYQDNIADTSHYGCDVPFNASELNGNIALIDRGNCNFTVKVKNAQNAGAIAAIVVDNVPGEYPIVMGGTDNSIVIPAVMVSYETGLQMKVALGAGESVAVSMKGGTRLDGDLDNGVIAHEYTHGISNRLTGGPNNVSCLFNAEEAGEGWSDYVGLMVTRDWSKATMNDGAKASPIGTYVLGQGQDGPGIRTYPYSTDMSIDPWTYADMASSGGEVHVIGEIWCTAVWEMTWNIIQQTNKIEGNFYKSNSNAGNTIAMQLVMQGMKLQPCRPGFIDGRNAILQADTLLYGGAYSAAIWKAFAKRGMGIYASQGSSNSTTDQIADFTEPFANPIVRGSLIVEKQNEKAVLQWQDLSQFKAGNFVIERSADGIHFEPIGQVELSDVATPGHYTDINPANGVNYYRIAQNDGGMAVRSEVKTLDFNGISVYPNPARDMVNVVVKGNTKMLKLNLVSATGKVIKTFEMSGEHKQLSLPALQPGMYLLKVSGDNFSQTQKLIIR